MVIRVTYLYLLFLVLCSYILLLACYKQLSKLKHSQQVIFVVNKSCSTINHNDQRSVACHHDSQQHHNDKNSKQNFLKPWFLVVSVKACWIRLYESTYANLQPEEVENKDKDLRKAGGLPSQTRRRRTSAALLE